jgi:hypothetical protein
LARLRSALSLAELESESESVGESRRLRFFL